MTFEEFFETMQALESALPKFAPKDIKATAVTWFTTFQHLDVGQMFGLVELSKRSFDEFPSLKAICELVTGSPEKEADELPEKIWACIRDYGSQKSKEHRVKERLGPIGWAFVERSGGWQRICDQATHDNMAPTLKAQWRNAIKAMLASPEVKAQHLGLSGTVQDEIKKLADRFSIGPSSRPQTRADD